MGDEDEVSPSDASGTSESTPEGDPYVRAFDDDAATENALDAAQKQADSNFPAAPVGDATSACGKAPKAVSPSKDSSVVKTWIEYVFIDDKGRPVPNRRYRVKAPDGEIFEGNFDANGKTRIESITPGSCKIWVLDVDGLEWKKG